MHSYDPFKPLRMVDQESPPQNTRVHSYREKYSILSMFIVRFENKWISSRRSASMSVSWVFVDWIDLFLNLRIFGLNTRIQNRIFLSGRDREKGREKSVSRERESSILTGNACWLPTHAGFASREYLFESKTKKKKERTGWRFDCHEINLYMQYKST